VLVGLLSCLPSRPGVLLGGPALAGTAAETGLVSTALAVREVLDRFLPLALGLVPGVGGELLLFLPLLLEVLLLLFLVRRLIPVLLRPVLLLERALLLAPRLLVFLLLVRALLFRGLL